MALTLLVRSSEITPAPELTFDSPRIVIGRSDGCDLRLPDPSVSQRHASIRQRGSDYIVMDEGSTNGTFVGPVKLPAGAPRVITAGDLIRVGRVWLEARITSALPQHTPAATREIALRLVATALAAQGEDSAPVVTVSSGPDQGKTLSLGEFGREYVLGRGNTVDLPLNDADASRRHLSITRNGDQLLVSDLGSKNGSTLGGEPLLSGAAVPWPPGVSVTIGNSVFDYQDPVREALLELENTPDERLLPSDLIAPPTGELGAPVLAAARRAVPDPRRGSSPQTATVPAHGVGWGLSDVLVLALALVVLTVSSLGLFWLFKAR